MPQKKWHKWKS